MTELEIYRKAIERIVSCSIPDPTRYIMKVDEIALEAKIKGDHMREDAKSR